MSRTAHHHFLRRQQPAKNDRQNTHIAIHVTVVVFRQFTLFLPRSRSVYARAKAAGDTPPESAHHLTKVPYAIAVSPSWL